MSAADIHDHITSRIGTSTPDSLTIDGQLFPGSTVAALFAEHLGADSLVVTEATVGRPGPTDTWVTVRGQTSVLSLDDVPVELRVSDVGEVIEFRIRFVLPSSWRFSHSFATLPTVLDFRDDGVATPIAVLDLVSFDDASLVLGSAPHTEPVHGAPLASGLSFVGRLQAAELLGGFARAFGGAASLVVHGPIVPPPGDPATAAPDEPLPGITLRATASAELSVGAVTLGDPWLQIYSPPDMAWWEGHPDDRPAITIGGELRCGQVVIDVSGEISPGGPVISISATGAGLRLPDFGDFTGLAGGADLLGDLAEHLPDVGAIDLDSVAMTIEWETLEITSVSFDASLPDVEWELVDDQLTIDRIAVSVTVTRPASAGRKVTATLTGAATVAGQLVAVTVSLPQGFVSAELRPTAPLRLSSLLQRYLPGVPPVSDLDVDTVRIAAKPGEFLNLWVLLAAEPEPFTIPIGTQELTVSNCEAVIEYRKGSGFASSFAGALSIAGARFAVSMAVPGPFSLRGELPAASLRSVVEELGGDVSLWPEGFDIGFERARVIVERDEKDHLFMLAADVEQLGTLVLQISRDQGRGGFVAGIDVADGWRDGPLHDLVGPLDSLVGFDRLSVVVSSIDDPTFVMPTFTDAAGTAGVTSSPRGVRRGVAIQADLRIDGTPLTISGSRTGDRWQASGRVVSGPGLSLERLFDRLTTQLADELGATALFPDDADLPLDATVSSVEIVIDGDDIDVGVRAEIDGADVRVDLSRRRGTWQPIIQASGVDLPDDLPIPASVAVLLERATVRWSPEDRVDVPRLGLTPGAIPAGVSMLTALPLHLTPIGELLELEATFVPIEYRSGAVRFGFRQELLGADDTIALGPLTINRLLVGYEAPAAFEVMLGCDLHLEIADTVTDLRFAGAVRADLMSRDVRLGIAFVGEVLDGKAGPWKDPFGFRGLTIGPFELWIGTGIRALRGSVQLGRSSLEVDVIWEPTDPLRTAVHFAGEALTLQELLTGFLGDDAPALPGPLGQSGFESIALDYAASDFDFAWLTGTRHYRKGLKGNARLHLFGLSAACTFDLEKRRLAASMDKVSFGSILELRAVSAPGPLPDWATGFADLGGPFVVLDLGSKPNGKMSGEITLFGALTKSIDADFDDTGLRLTIEDRVTTGVLDWSTRLTVDIRSAGRASRVAVSGGLSASLEINPRELGRRFLGTDLPILPDINLVDIALDVQVAVEVRATGASGSLAVSLILWGHPLTLSIAVDIDLDFEAIGKRAIAAVEDAAVEMLNFFNDLAEAIVKAVEAVIEALEEFGEAIVAAFEELAELAQDIAEAFEELGRAIEALLEEGWADFLDFFGDDSGRRQLEDRRRLAAERQARLEADQEFKRAEARRLDQERRLLLLDVIENLADGAAIDATAATKVQERIDRSEVSGRNPFTDLPEQDPITNRAQSDALWQQALGRARTRAALRETYLAAIEVADRQLGELSTELVDARAVLDVVRGRHQQAQAALDLLLDRRDEVRKAFEAAARLVTMAREGVVKVEVAIDEASALGDLLASDREALSRAADVGQLAAAAAFASARLTQDLAAIDALVADGRVAAAATALEVDAATRSVAEAEELVRLYRTCRATLTLARLDAVRRSMTAELTGESAFAAWVEACRVAGSPALVNISSLREQAEWVLRRLPDLAHEATAAAAASTERQLSRFGSAGSPLTVEQVLAEIDEALATAATTVATAATTDASDEVGSWIGAALDPAALAPSSTPSLVSHRRPVDSAALAVWIAEAPLARALAELHRRHDTASIDAATELLVVRWATWRAIDAQLADARVRVEANLSLQTKLAAERARHRVLVARGMAERYPRGTDLAVLLEPGTRYETEKDDGRTITSAFRRTDTLTGWITSLDDDTVVMRYQPTLDPFRTPETYTFPTRSIVHVEPWQWAIEVARGFEGLIAEIGFQIDQGLAPLRGIQPGVDAVARARAEVDALTTIEALARGAVNDALAAHQHAGRLGLVQTARSFDLTRAALDAITGPAGRAALDAVGTPEPAGIRTEIESEVRRAGDRLQRVRSLADVVAVDDAAVLRLVGWSNLVVRHAAAVDAAQRGLAQSDRELDTVASDVLAGWRRSIALAVADLVTGAAERARSSLAVARGQLLDAERSATTVVQATDVDLSTLTATLRVEIAGRRTQLDGVLGSIRQLALGDTAAMEAGMRDLEDAVGSAAAELASVSSGLTALEREIDRQRTGSTGDPTLVAVGAMHLTVIATDDERLLRSVVARAEMVRSRVAELDHAMATVQRHLATSVDALDTFTRSSPSVEGLLPPLERGFTDLSAQVTAIASSIPAILDRVVRLVDEVRRHQRAVIDAHVEVVAARCRAATALDLVLGENARVAAVGELLTTSPTAATEPRSVLVDVGATIQRHVEQVVVADAELTRYADALERTILDTAAELAVIHATSRERLEAARGQLDAADLEAVGEPPRSLLDGEGAGRFPWIETVPHAWVLDVDEANGTLLDVAPGAEGNIRTSGRATRRTLFRLGLVGSTPAGTGVMVDIRSVANGAALDLTVHPRCRLDVVDPAAWEDVQLGPDGHAQLATSWLVSGADGMRVSTSEPSELRVVVEIDDDAGTFQLLRWTAAGVRYRLLGTGTRLLVIAGESRIVAASNDLGRMKAVEVVIERDPEGGYGLQLRLAEQADNGAAPEGAALSTPAGRRLGTIHRVKVTSGDGTTDPTDEVTFDTSTFVRAGTGGSVVDSMIGTLGRPIRAAEAVAVAGEVTVAGWIRLEPEWRRDGWTAWSLVDATGREVLGCSGRPGGAPHLSVIGRDIALPSLFTGSRWTHLGVRMTTTAGGRNLIAYIDGAEVARERLDAPVEGELLLTAGIEHCSVDRVTLWNTAVTPDDLADHLLQPRRAPRRVPVVDWVIDPGREVQGAGGIDGLWSAPVTDATAVALAPFLARGSHRGTSTLEATVVGERHGRPTFVVGDTSSGRPRWLAVDHRGEVFSTPLRAEAAEVGLRAIVVDRVPVGEPIPWYRAYGGDHDDPRDMVRWLGVPPATPAIVEREFAWTEACRRAEVNRTVAELDWLAATAKALALAGVTLQAAWIDVAFDGLDTAAAVALVEQVSDLIDADPEGVGVVPVGPTGTSVTFGEPPLAVVLDRWETAVAAASRHSDPVAALLTQLGVPTLRDDDGADSLHRSLEAAGARVLPAAVGWDLPLWAAALRTWQPASSSRLGARCDHLAAVGLDVRVASSPVPDVAAARRWALGEARRALSAVPPRPLDARALTTRLQVDLLLAAPLTPTERSWLSEAAQRGILLDLTSPLEPA